MSRKIFFWTVMFVLFLWIAFFGLLAYYVSESFIALLVQYVAVFMVGDILLLELLNDPKSTS